MPTFALLYAAMARHPSQQRAADIAEAYFPYFSALHILLDYFIDQAEDRNHRELNFVACYPTERAAADGIARIAGAAFMKLHRLPDADVHIFALQAMCAFYCSRSKVRRQALTGAAAEIMRAVGVQGTQPILPLLKLYAQLAR